MTQNSNKPTRSAEVVAALRTASTKERDPIVANPDHLARHFVTSYFYSRLISLPEKDCRDEFEKILPGSYCYFLARTKFVDKYFTRAVNEDIKQIVILGAGYDTRSIRLLNENSDVTVYEIDLPGTQNDKLEKMKKAKLTKNNNNVVYIASDFNKTTLTDLLKNNDFNFDEPAFFIFEGVSYYLEESATRNVFEFVAKNCVKKSSIVYDYSLKSFVDGSDDTYGGKQIQDWIKENNEPFKFGLHPDDNVHFMASCGLNVKTDLGPKEITEAYLSSQTEGVIGKPLGHLRMVYAVN